jgi:hypothetical protein
MTSPPTARWVGAVPFGLSADNRTGAAACCDPGCDEARGAPQGPSPAGRSAALGIFHGKWGVRHATYPVALRKACCRAGQKLAAVNMGSYPIVTFQCSSTTLYQVSYHTK